MTLAVSSSYVDPNDCPFWVGHLEKIVAIVMTYLGCETLSWVEQFNLSLWRWRYECKKLKKFECIENDPIGVLECIQNQNLFTWKCDKLIHFIAVDFDVHETIVFIWYTVGENKVQKVI